MKGSPYSYCCSRRLPAAIVTTLALSTIASLLHSTEQPNLRRSKIAFVARHGTEPPDIFVMNPDGSGRVNLTNRPSFDMAPKLSPDGTRIVFMVGRGEAIWLMNSDGSEVEKLMDNAKSPAWSPDGTTILYVSEEAIWRMDLKTKKKSLLVGDLGRVRFESNPVWSPDGSRIAYYSSMEGTLIIHMMRPDGTDVRAVTQATSSNFCPAWSPDGKKLAFVSWRDGNKEIYVMKADGSQQTRLTFREWDDSIPCWSPDGKKIAFESEEREGYGIFVMNADGSNVRRLTGLEIRAAHPSWSLTQPKSQVDK